MYINFKKVNPIKSNPFISIILISVVFIIAMCLGQALALLSAAGTLWAAYATWQAAKEAAKSAEIARESMEATQVLGKATLKETQITNQRTAFESRYSMLLAQHDNYHQQLCTYLDSRHPVKKGDEGSYRSEVAKREINAFFDESIYDERLEGCFSFLTGHQIISRYMRVLYHLLKFVRENGDFNGSDPITFQKNYTSPLRSTIRNDVLLLIAVNALNVRDERARKSSYPYYQKLLHDFGFFEHAIFMFPTDPNKLFQRDDWEDKIHDLVLNTQSKFTMHLNNQTSMRKRTFKVPKVRLISPLIMVITIFDNPMRKAALEAFDSIGKKWTVSGQVLEKIEKVVKSFQHSKSIVDKLASCQYKSPSNSTWRLMTEEIISEMHERKFSEFCIYDDYIFKLPVDGSISEVSGTVIREQLCTLHRTEGIVKEFETYNNAEGYAPYLMQLIKAKIEGDLAEIAAYNVKNSLYADK